MAWGSEDPDGGRIFMISVVFAKLLSRGAEPISTASNCNSFTTSPGAAAIL